MSVWTDQASRRASLRSRQEARDRRAKQRIRLDRIKQLAITWDAADTKTTATLERLAHEAIVVEDLGLAEDELPPRLLRHLIDRGRVAVFRGRVTVRGRR